MKFEIVEVYKGEKYDDTALSEIYFDGMDVHCFLAGTKILMSDNPRKYIWDLHETGLLKYIIPELEEAWGFNQNSKYHSMNLTDHMFSVLDLTVESLKKAVDTTYS